MTRPVARSACRPAAGHEAPSTRGCHHVRTCRGDREQEGSRAAKQSCATASPPTPRSLAQLRDSRVLGAHRARPASFSPPPTSLKTGGRHVTVTVTHLTCGPACVLPAFGPVCVREGGCVSRPAAPSNAPHVEAGSSRVQDRPPLSARARPSAQAPIPHLSSREGEHRRRVHAQVVT
jgi:hypothetical protein